MTGAAGAVGGWLIELAGRQDWDVTALVRPGTEYLADAKEVLTDVTGSYDAVLDAAALGGPALAAVRDGGHYVGFKPGRPPAPERRIAVSTSRWSPTARAWEHCCPSPPMAWPRFASPAERR